MLLGPQPPDSSSAHELSFTQTYFKTIVFTVYLYRIPRKKKCFFLFCSLSFFCSDRRSTLLRVVVRTRTHTNFLRRRSFARAFFSSPRGSRRFLPSRRCHHLHLPNNNSMLCETLWGEMTSCRPLPRRRHDGITVHVLFIIHTMAMSAVSNRTNQQYRERTDTEDCVCASDDVRGWCRLKHHIDEERDHWSWSWRWRDRDIRKTYYFIYIIRLNGFERGWNLKTSYPLDGCGLYGTTQYTIRTRTYKMV